MIQRIYSMTKCTSKSVDCSTCMHDYGKGARGEGA